MLEFFPGPAESFKTLRNIVALHNLTAQRVSLLGNGVNLRKDHLHQLPGLTFGMNRTAWYYVTDFFLSLTADWYRELDVAHRVYRKHTQFVLVPEGRVMVFGGFALPVAPGNRLRLEPPFAAYNTGMLALQAVLALGFRKIHMLGFDNGSLHCDGSYYTNHPYQERFIQEAASLPGVDLRVISGCDCVECDRAA